MTTRLRSFATSPLLLFTGALRGDQEAVDPVLVARIREEALQRWQVMEYEGYLTDVLGARLTRLLRTALSFALCLSPLPLAAQHDHGGHAGHAGAPVDCRTLAAPPWSGLSQADRAVIDRMRQTLQTVAEPTAARAAGFAPQLGDIPTMGVHWTNRARMRDPVQADAPDHLLFTRIGGRDSLVGVAYAFRGPVDATIPKMFESPLASWHDHADLGGGTGTTLHMLHVWFVPSPYGPFAGNNFFLPLLAAGRVLPNPCWIQSDADVTRLETLATLSDLLHRAADSSAAPAVAPRRDTSGTMGAIGALPMLASVLKATAARLTPQFAALDAAARAGDRAAWERAADETLAALRPGERRVVDLVRARVKGAQASMAGQRR